MTDLRYHEIEQELRRSVRDLLADHAPASRVLAGVERGTTAELTGYLWHRLAAELGCAGLAVPEKLGGAGASWREAAVVLEELGRAVAPVPFLGSAVVATAVLLHAGEEELLATLASGAGTAALAVPFGTGPDGPRAGYVTVENGRLTGRVPDVADALDADWLLVPAADAVYAVPAGAASRTSVTSLDLTRPLCDVHLAGATGRRVAEADPAGAVRAGLAAGAGLIASEQLGVAEWCLDTTVAYTKDRVQFARPVGSFQAVKHRLADVWVAITQARAAARYAADCLATGDPDTGVAVSLAKAYCSGAVVRAAEECVQLHGGIGFTWEHPAHLYLKRAKSTAIAWGTAERHRAALAALVDLPA